MEAMRGILRFLHRPAYGGFLPFLLGAVLLPLARAEAAYDAYTEYTIRWNNEDGDFFDPTKWLDEWDKPAGRIPGPEDRVIIPGGTITLTNRFVVGNLMVCGATLVWRYPSDGTSATACRVTGDAEFTYGCLTHVCGYGSPVPSGRVHLEVVSNMTIATHATINANALGYYGDIYVHDGPGGQPTQWGGGSHAGLAWEGTAYGSIRAPLEYGSAGVGYRGRADGGGSVRLAVGGTLTMDGQITANGLANIAGGGAGGSIWITAGRVTGSETGLISASGVRGEIGWDEGGGGRVSIVETVATNSTSVRVRVSGCAAGTIYYENASDEKDCGTLVVGDTHDDAEGAFGTYINDAIADGKPTFGAVRLGENAFFHIANGFTLKVTKGWQGAATSSVRRESCGRSYEGMVEFTGPEPAVFSGHCRFYNFRCTEPGKMLLIGPDDELDSFKIINDGSFTIRGTTNRPVGLLASTNGKIWDITFAERVAASVTHARIMDSVANISMTAYDSKDEGGNVNWTFADTQLPGDPMMWTGEAGFNWTDAANWRDSKGAARTPLDTDRITIPAAVPRMPVLSNDAHTFNEITVAEGASLTLGGIDLSVTNAFRVAGILVAYGSSTITLPNVFEIAPDAITDLGDTTFKFVGERDQSVVTGGHLLPTLIVSKPLSTVTFPDGLKAGAFIAPAYGLTFAFGAGTTLEAETIACLGATLKSTVDGSPWFVKPTGGCVFGAVAVRDATATAQFPARADGESQDLGNNVNWLFGEKLAIFTGLVDNDFHTRDNWTSDAVPDAETDVLIVPALGPLIGARASAADLRRDGAVRSVTFPVGTQLIDWFTLHGHTLKIGGAP